MTNDAYYKPLQLDLTEDKSTILISSSPLDRELLKTVPGARWNPDINKWQVRANWSSCMVLKGIFGDRLQVSEDIKQYAADLLRTVIAPQRELREKMVLPDDELVELRAAMAAGGVAFEPRKYQSPGGMFLASGNFNCLFDPMGTGKTFQLILAAHLMKHRGVDIYPMMIVCPNSVKPVWLDGFAANAPHVRIVDAGNHAGARKKAITAILKGEADVMVTNWEALPRNSKLAAYGGTALTRSEKEPQLYNTVRWRSVVADEIHRAKNPNAKQTRALWAIGQGEDVIWRKGLTGTPIGNSPADLWSCLHFVDHEEYGNKSKWLDRYCILALGEWGGVQVLGINPMARTEFNHTTEHYWRRVPKEIALPELPPKVYSKRIIEMSPAQAKQYKQMAEQQLVEFAEELESGNSIIAINPLAKMTRLLQFAAATCKLGDAGRDGKPTVEMMDPSSKIDELLDVLDEVEGQVVVFAQSRKLIELAAARLEKKGITYGMITGGVSTDERRANIAKFQEPGSHMRVMLCTIRAGGTGITLTAASTVVFLQREFSNIENAQAEDRLHRIGAEIHESLLVIDILCNNTVDFRVQELAGMKSAQLQDLVRDRDRLMAFMLGTGQVFNDAAA